MDVTRLEQPPTPGQLRVLAAYVRTGSQKAAAHECEISLQTVKNHLSALYARLDVGGGMEAVSRLGWVRIPGEEPPQECRWTGYCSRPLGHLGHHGAMRALVPATT